jgi:sensor histidine kinase regulating citrate/malate metabolism
VTDGDPASVSGYIEKLLKISARNSMQRYCANKAANAIIGSYMNIARTKGIGISVEAHIPESIGIGDYELSALFGNAIENAIEACERIYADSPLFEKRYICIRVKTEPDCMIIRIENSCGAVRKDDNHSFLSSKGSIGGIGMNSIKMIVDAYSGYMSADVLNDAFILSIVLKLPDETR